MRMSLDGKVAVNTNAARGIGRACVRAFLAQGANIVAIDLSWEPTGFSNDRDDSFRRELKARPDDVLLVTCDVAQPSQVEAAYEAAMRKFGTADFLFNNAGVRMRDLYPPAGQTVTLATSRADWQRMFDVTVFGAIDLSRLFIKPMIEKRAGSIVAT